MHIELKAVPGKGRGVFARKNFKKDDMIEICPVIPIPKEQFQFIEKTELDNYYFTWEPNEEGCAIVLGYGMLYNHSYCPNACIRRSFKNKTVTFRAYKAIKKGEEITHNYNLTPKGTDKVWFDVLDERGLK